MLAVIVVLIGQISALYSSYHSRCRVPSTAAIPLEQLQPQRVPVYPHRSHSIPIIDERLPLNFSEFEDYFVSLLGSGNSGTAYLVEDAKTNRLKVAKIYNSATRQDLSRQNFFLHKINSEVSWSKICLKQHCGHEQYSIVAIYPYYQSIPLKRLVFDAEDAPLIFYKLLKRLAYLHSRGIVHCSVKSHNIIIASNHTDFSFYQAQLIDWDLVRSYYTGKQSTPFGLTPFILPPEAIFGSEYLTPAVDIWQLGMTMHQHHVNSYEDNNENPRRTVNRVIALVGGNRVVRMYRKYNYANISKYSIIREAEKYPQKFPRAHFTTHVQHNGQRFSYQFAQVLERMLEPDPELRASAEELMQMPYFSKLRRLPEADDKPKSSVQKGQQT